jgi:hypothetical protein
MIDQRVNWRYYMRPCLTHIVLVLLLWNAVPSFAQDRPPYRTGLRFIDPAQYAGIPLATRAFSGVLPPTKELAPFATPGFQGQQGSCVAFAVAFALKTYQEAIERNWPINREHIFSPAFIYNQVKLSDCQGGSTFPDALNFLTTAGVVSLAAFPYTDAECDRVPEPLVQQSAREFRADHWRRINTLDEMEVKTHIAAGFPVLFGMDVDAAFQHLAAGSIYQNFQGPSLGGHAMILTGYDDQKGAFHILNSWGTGWSDGGRGWISYGALRKYALEGYVVQDFLPPAAVQSEAPILEFETIILSESRIGTRSVSKTTGNHHCSFNCKGEPTRTNYTLDLAASDATRLRNPQLRCVAGPCEGWNAVLSVRLETDGRVAHASWDVWTMPTTWELAAEEIREREVSRFTRRELVGSTFTVASETGAPPPRISGRFATGETFSFVAGQPTGNPRLRFVKFEVQGPETLYYYESQ